MHFQLPQPRLLTHGDEDTGTNSVRICLREKGVEYVEQPVPRGHAITYAPNGRVPVLVDIDRERSAVAGVLAILQYIEMYYSSGPWLMPSPVDERARYARALGRLQDAGGDVAGELAAWERYVDGGEGFMVGGDISLVDIAVYPVLEKLRKEGREMGAVLTAYLERMRERNSVKTVYKLESAEEKTVVEATAKSEVE